MESKIQYFLGIKFNFLHIIAKNGTIHALKTEKLTTGCVHVVLTLI